MTVFPNDAFFKQKQLRVIHLEDSSYYLVKIVVEIGSALIIYLI